jgi:hypothetical protein
MPHLTEVCWRMETKLRATAAGGRGRPGSCSSRFTSWEIANDSHLTGSWVGTRPCLGAEIVSSCSYRETTSECPAYNHWPDCTRPVYLQHRLTKLFCGESPGGGVSAWEHQHGVSIRRQHPAVTWVPGQACYARSMFLDTENSDVTGIMRKSPGQFLANMPEI